MITQDITQFENDAAPILVGDPDMDQTIPIVGTVSEWSLIILKIIMSEENITDEGQKHLDNIIDRISIALNKVVPKVGQEIMATLDELTKTDKEDEYKRHKRAVDKYISKIKLSQAYKDIYEKPKHQTKFIRVNQIRKSSAKS
jgi:hypothetical protein